MKITEQELEIFSRQLILKEFDLPIFNNLQKKKISVIGLGGIGCPTSQYLVASGVKKLNLFDKDIVQKTNLNRQLLYSIKDIGKNKAFVAKQKLLGINPDSEIKSYDKNITKKNINLLKNSSIIIDASDNWQTMKLINKYCVTHCIPLISSSVIGFDAQVILFKNAIDNHICLQCIFPNTEEPKLARCESVGVMGTATGLAGIITAQKTINYLLQLKNEKNVITMIDTKSCIIRNIITIKNDNCINYKKNKI